MREVINSFRELVALMLRSTLARRRHPHVYFGHNVAVGKDCHFGANVRIYFNIRLSSVEIGDYSYVGGGSYIQHAKIGKFCSIGPDVRIGLGVHPLDHVSTYPGFYSTNASGSVPFTKDTIVEENVRICIGNDVWIGAKTLIMDGVSIGHGAVIGAGSVVTKNVAPYTVVAGVPARELRKRFDEDMVAFLLEFAWWDKDEAFLRTHAASFRSPEVFRDEFKL
jgi:acetyltransferase-like isoleucine patch superfamily enzyme